MKNVKLLQMLGEIDEKHVSEADRDVELWLETRNGVKVTVDSTRKRSPWRIITAASCSAAAAIGVFVLLLTAARIGNSGNTAYSEGDAAYSDGDNTQSEITESTASANNDPEQIEKIVPLETAIPIKTATENFAADFEDCKNRSYPNLDWSGATSFPVPVVSECYAIDDRITHPNADMTVEEKISLFENYCRTFLGEYDPENACFETYHRELLGNDYTIEGIDGVKFTAFPKFLKYEDKIRSGEIEPYYFLYVDNIKQKYLWWLSDTAIYPHWYNKGQTLSMLDKYIKASAAIPTDLKAVPSVGEPVAIYPNDGTHNDESYRLLDGEVTIGEALDFINNKYFRSINFADEDIQNIAVRYIYVYRVTEDIYAYNFIFTNAVDKIPFDYSGERSLVGNDMGTFSPISHESQALMIKKNDIDWAVGVGVCRSAEVGEPITKIISFSEAADILSGWVTGNYKVLSAELVMTAGITAENKSPLLLPTWKFSMIRENDDKHTDYYINAVNGKIGHVRYSPFY